MKSYTLYPLPSQLVKLRRSFRFRELVPRRAAAAAALSGQALHGVTRPRRLRRTFETMSRRPLIALLGGLLVIGLLAAGLARLFDTTPPPNATRAERLYLAHCAHCHGVDGRGSWWATVSILRPGDFTDATRMTQHTGRYLFDIIKHGGSPIGRPGMPGFEHLSDADVEALVAYIRTFARPSARQ